MEANNIKTPITSTAVLIPNEADKNTSNILNNMYRTSKNYITKKENQRKILKTVGKISSSIILGGYAFKIIPLLTPNLTKTVCMQVSEAFPGLIESVDLIPKKQIQKISSNLCLFTGIASSLIGKDIKDGSIKAYRDLNPKDLL